MLLASKPLVSGGRARALKEYRKRNGSGAVYDDPRVAVGAGRVDGVGARAEAESTCKAIPTRRQVICVGQWCTAYRRGVVYRGRSRTNVGSRRQ